MMSRALGRRFYIFCRRLNRKHGLTRLPLMGVVAFGTEAKSKESSGFKVRDKTKVFIIIYQWYANPDISNPNPDPNPDTSNPNRDESEPTISFLLNPNPNLDPVTSNPNPDSNPTGNRRPQVAFRIRIWIRIRIHPFFLESESGFAFMRSEYESESESS